MAEVLAVYPGTFDPWTLGHEDVVRRGRSLFARVIVAVAAGYHKRTMFSLEERRDMVVDSLAGIDGVEVAVVEGLMRDFVLAHGATALLRGVRTAADVDYEFRLAGVNRHLMPGVETVFLMAAQPYSVVSGTFVREILALGGDVRPFVGTAVHARLVSRRADASTSKRL
ncbi:pantetheine-phosphate adenylyltransferase [Candidatus Symbiobacter mobilis]|uniref:Phosphopantetheine adenylyltransferase n=1 Tax=Candidatus Symbiobacter mobilis CR TaxID=946483 RepID=U5N590_9BURK|nr:pantetheine-phosphate adenylyltransferase [Candidatus Symbiobacter mobilis]AGX86420.1 pantetheine-phosphate adenylyltransferase [Candidatus Symbiobacter mobilis CR]